MKVNWPLALLFIALFIMSASLLILGSIYFGNFIRTEDESDISSAAGCWSLGTALYMIAHQIKEL